ncbi:MAG: aldehyde dehydrogenase family protein, partial [Verrucomicrobiia bacterium]
VAAMKQWRALPLIERVQALRQAQMRLRTYEDLLARGISVETGKPITEARAEVEAVLTRFDYTISDAESLVRPTAVEEAVLPSWIRRRPRGPAVVISPAITPLDFANGALIAYLAAGNTAILKPSPQAGAVAAEYANLMGMAFPPGVFQVVQGWGSVGERLASHAQVRSVCFIGSISVGQTLAARLASDYSKDLAMHLGGKCAAIVLEDGAMGLAAESVAKGLCLSAGQRCNSTARVLVAEKVVHPFLENLLVALDRFRPGDPMKPTTLLGPLISAESVADYLGKCASKAGDWIRRGKAAEQVHGKRGHYVYPAVVVYRSRRERIAALLTPLAREEVASPILEVYPVADADDAIQLHNSLPFGLTSSVFTRSEETFWKMADMLNVGNIYANLPTTLSPAALPFGGLGACGNRHPAGRGFIRFCSDEQAVQLLENSFSAHTT